jgi:hypothetical protein
MNRKYLLFSAATAGGPVVEPGSGTGRRAAGVPALRAADQSVGHRSHRPVPEMGAEQRRTRPGANHSLTVGGLDAREAGRRRGRLVEFGQGRWRAVGAGGLRGRAAAQPHPLLLEGADVDQPGRIGVERADTVEYGPAEHGGGSCLLISLLPPRIPIPPLAARWLAPAPPAPARSALRSRSAPLPRASAGSRA